MFNSRKYNLDSKKANETLQNVFAACDVQPNTTSFEIIRVRNIANTTLVRTGKWMSVCLLILVLLCPLPFKAAESKGTKTFSSKVNVVNHYLDEEKGYFVMILDGIGIDYNGIYAKEDDGTVVMPAEIDEDNKIVCIPFEEGNLNIYIPKDDGTVTQAVLSR